MSAKTTSPPTLFIKERVTSLVMYYYLDRFPFTLSQRNSCGVNYFQDSQSTKCKTTLNVFCTVFKSILKLV